MGLNEDDVGIIVEEPELAVFFDDVIKLNTNIKISVNFLMGEIAAYLKDTKIGINSTKLSPANLVELVNLIENGVISNNIGKQIIFTMLKDGTSAKQIVEQQGLVQISDEGALKEIVQKVISSNPEQVTAYKSGKTQLLGFFVGQIMKETKGRANPKTVNELIRELLG